QGILVEVAGGAGQRGVAGGIRGTAGEGVVELGVALRTAHGNPAEAAIVETMGQFADEIGGSAVEMVPVRAEEGIAVQVQQIAGGVGRVTVVRRDVLFLVQESQRQHGAVGQVELQGAIEV